MNTRQTNPKGNQEYNPEIQATMTTRQTKYKIYKQKTMKIQTKISGQTQ